MESVNITIENIRNHETFKKAEELCNKYGYELFVLINKVYDKFNLPILQVIPKEENKYAPSIYFVDNSLSLFKTKDEDKYAYEIQTTSYGSLDMSEYKKFMKQTSDAYQLVEELSEIPVESWPQVDCRGNCNG